jgi:pimeloyl-ACP methyl ester carboxylesterase
MDIDLREPVQLGESTQWIRIRSANARNPLLLLVQMGPGLPMINEVPAFGRALSLEDDFMVIYWDQRGCGRSLRSAGATRGLSLSAMTGDTERLLTLLRDRFDRPAVVTGFSMGLVSLLRSPDYSLADTVRAFRGITAAQAALLPELAALDLPRTLPRLDTPIVMAQGRHDQVAPPSAAERYAESLQAPHKQLV